MASKPTLQDLLHQELEAPFSARHAAAEMLLQIITRPDWTWNAGVPARLLDMMGAISEEMLKSKHLHRALRPEFARILKAAGR
ncbi:hypothetical protein [Fuscovulum blasticum]|uniref:hypothetical protein n=1 Tax=Fuscovulum blasticum TaxID=1075 RepID=UPI000D3EABAA|nr:hypothetical protein [Fuscovulum blasticum]AWD20992.1 hypothetical protein B6K69_04330 [Fuscovulum blasticum]